MSLAEQLDRAIDDLVTGARPVTDGELRPLLIVAAALREAPAPPPVARRFEAQLAARLRDPWSRARLVATAGVSSAAIGLAGVTAYAVWRVAHR
jgi:hypothetical protein